jgi:hypothetical protein
MSLIKEEAKRCSMHKIFCIFLFLSLYKNAYGDNTYVQVKNNNPSLTVSRAIRISSAINSTAKKYNIKPKLLTAILMQESSYKLDAKNCKVGLFWRGYAPDYAHILPFMFNNQDVRKHIKPHIGKICQDFGIGQINHATIVRKNIEIIKLISDIDYSIDTAGMIIGYLKNTYEKYEPDNWWTRYNAISKDKRNIYKKLVTRYMR